MQSILAAPCSRSPARLLPSCTLQLSYPRRNGALSMVWPRCSMFLNHSFGVFGGSRHQRHSHWWDHLHHQGSSFRRTPQEAEKIRTVTPRSQRITSDVFHLFGGPAPKSIQIGMDFPWSKASSVFGYVPMTSWKPPNQHDYKNHPPWLLNVTNHELQPLFNH